MSFENIQYIWKDGEIIQWKEATVHVSAHGLHYGSGVFEGIRCYETPKGPVVFRLREHLERFHASATTYNFTIPYTIEVLTDAVLELVRANDLASCYIRPIAYLGSESLSVHPGRCQLETAILAWPWGAYLGRDAMENGIRVTVSPWRKFHSSMLPTTSKACGQYLNSILAVQDAVARGFDEAILLDKDGRLAEGSAENLFLVRKGTVYTNKADDSILLGITRATTMEIARDLGYSVEASSLELTNLLTADEAFLTGTAAEITPIREVDGHVIGNECPGVVTKKIQATFFAAVSGTTPRYSTWLSPIGPKTKR